MAANNGKWLKSNMQPPPLKLFTIRNTYMWFIAKIISDRGNLCSIMHFSNVVQKEKGCGERASSPQSAKIAIE